MGQGELNVAAYRLKLEGDFRLWLFDQLGEMLVAPAEQLFMLWLIRVPALGEAEVGLSFEHDLADIDELLAGTPLR